ncbi:hypothetical protein GCM10010470_06810 [Saccharopolyspora taberi]|uniref:DUF2752 domain-containing protein n=1 Tax=Saccharopolyspora taberi TaxID=60895 RepID=A0ABN3V3E1_9PSEU
MGAGALGLLLATGVLAVPCPFKLLTGLDCPFCGGSRMLGALLAGDLGRALDLNAFALLVVLPLAASMLIAGVLRDFLAVRIPGPGRTAGMTLLVLLAAWSVLRNLPFEPFLVLRA